MLEKSDGTGSFPVCNPNPPLPLIPLECKDVTFRAYSEDKQKTTSCAQAIKELVLPEGFSRYINISSWDDYRNYVVLTPVEPCGC